MLILLPLNAGQTQQLTSIEQNVVVLILCDFLKAMKRSASACLHLRLFVLREGSHHIIRTLE